MSISANSFPLNVGYIGSFSCSRFGSKIDLKLFKFIDELEEAIKESPPDILGLSNYCWNHNLGLEIFRILRGINPNALTVWGGPNLPRDRSTQIEWLSDSKEPDVYVPFGGEIGFSNLVESALSSGSNASIRDTVLTKTIDGCIIRDPSGKMVYGNPVQRIKDIDNFPSPYLTGIMDKFFDGRLLPMISTNRGCPFTCAYCVDGSEQMSKVDKFSMERVESEIRYIAEHVTKQTHFLGITDSNFGMYARDLDICDILYSVQNEFGYPKSVGASTGKNAKENVVGAIKKLRGSLELMIAVQSMDKQVLKNVDRINISAEKMLELSPAIKESGLKTKAEVILGLPGDNYDAHMKTLKTLIDADLDEILTFTFMLLPGSKLYLPEESKKWDYIVKSRIIPRNFGKLGNGRMVIETEECVVGSNTMSFEEYIELRLFNFIIYSTRREVVYDAIFKFLREQKVDVFKLFQRMLKNITKGSIHINEVFDSFKDATKTELWDSHDEIMEYYQEGENYNKLLNGEDGINVLYYHLSLVTAKYMSEWTEYVITIAQELLDEENLDKDTASQYNDIANYCRGISFKPLDKDRMSHNPEYEFNYDVSKWLKDANLPKKGMELRNYKFESRKQITFIYSRDQFSFIEDLLSPFDFTIDGIGKALFTSVTVSGDMLWRKPHLAD
ncbi:MAG: radical SAM protein [Candidatus Scalindua sp.]|nr:radical SAM protein [Candidatus Scalindua sp.]